MIQTKKQMLTETVINTAIGFIGAYLISHFMIMKFSNTMYLALMITVACTLWSLVRGFCLRYYFNSSKWRKNTYVHLGSGRLYHVIAESNQESTREDFPPTTIYSSGKTVWSRPTAEFNEKFMKLD